MNFPLSEGQISNILYTIGLCISFAAAVIFFVAIFRCNKQMVSDFELYPLSLFLIAYPNFFFLCFDANLIHYKRIYVILAIFQVIGASWVLSEESLYEPGIDLRRFTTIFTFLVPNTCATVLIFIYAKQEILTKRCSDFFSWLFSLFA